MKIKFICFSILLFILNSCKLKQEKSDSPNFILFLTDDQSWSGTSVQMSPDHPSSKSFYYETPNLKKLSERGMVFSRGYSASPVCSPSRYSIQFGKTAARLKMIRVGMNTSHIDHNQPNTIPKVLKDINPEYKTAHFGKWGIDADPSILGYDFHDGKNGNKEGGFNNDNSQWKISFSEDPKNIFSLTAKAINFIEKQKENNKPFFLQLSHYALHTNLISKKSTYDKYLNKKKYSETDHPGFAAMNEDLDQGLGLILNKIEELDLSDNTYIIYTADNGSVPTIPARKFYKKSINYPLSRGKWDAMEGGIRVPFIIAGPGIKPESINNIPVSGYDLLPTIIDIIDPNYKFSDQIDGGSFKEILFSNKIKSVKRGTDGLIFHVPYENKIALERAHSSIIRDNFKLIKFRDNNEINLFNLNSDISELNNLIDSFPNISNELETTLENYLKNVKSIKWREGINWKNIDINDVNSFYE